MKVFVLGTGNKIVNQYPSKDSNLYKDSIVVLLTDEYNKKIPNLEGLSYKDAINILKLMGVKYNINGTGYVKNQNIKEGTIIEDNMIVELNLSN